MLRSVLTTLLLILLAGVLLAFGLRWLEPALIYFPTVRVERTPREAGMAYREVAVTTRDGESLKGWWVPAAAPDAPALLFFHGNAGNREHRLHNLQGLHAAGIAVFIFDYRGYGGSTGKPSEDGLLLDGEAAYDWLRGEVGDRPIFIFGRSLGGAVAALIALRRPAAGLILESTFTSARAMAFRVLPIPGIGYITRTRLDVLAAVRRLTLPMLFIHGEQDEVVPFRMGRTLYEAAATSDKTFHAVPGGHHNDTYLLAGEAYWSWLVDFTARGQAGRDARKR